MNNIPCIHQLRSQSCVLEGAQLRLALLFRNHPTTDFLGDNSPREPPPQQNRGQHAVPVVNYSILGQHAASPK